MRIGEAAILVERDSLPAVACAGKQGVKPVLVMFAQMRYHSSAIPFPLKVGVDCQVLQLQCAVPLVRHHGYGYGRCGLVLHDEHFASIQVSVNHGFLFVPDEQEGQIKFLAGCDG